MILDNLETSKWEGRGLLGLQIDKISRTDGLQSGSQAMLSSFVTRQPRQSVESNKDYLVS